MSQEEEFPFVWNMIYFPLVFGMFVLNFISDAAPKYVEGEIKSDVCCSIIFGFLIRQFYFLNHFL